jgi:serine protease Do
MNRLGKIFIIIAGALLLGVILTGGAVADRVFGFKPLDALIPRTTQGLKIGTTQQGGINQKVLTEESVVIDVAEKVSPSVVTVSIETPTRRIMEFSPFGGFQQRVQGGEPQDIGSGFVVSSDGMIVTNKHVVSDKTAKYKVITKDNKEYPVTQINRDPSNDVAILKIDATGLTPVELGDSDNLKVGQFAIAIGTALGEFRHTVTTGVISGLGRGISAGSAFEGYVEQLDNVIQTDAAINPGNSGGPLLNSAGQVIGINVAVAQGAQNIGFAIPIKVVKESLYQFKTSGKFIGKPFLGVQYQMVDRRTALLNNVPQGAYVTDVITGSPAEKAGLEVDDIITKVDGQDLSTEDTLGSIISKKKVGDQVKLTVYRGTDTKELTATLSESSGSQ